MKFKVNFLLLIAVCLIFVAAKNRPVHIFMAGDSTMADKLFYKNITDSLTGDISQEVFLERGWGQLLPEFFLNPNLQYPSLFYPG